MMLELTIKIEAGDLYDYMLMHSYNSPAGLIGSAFGALLIVFAFATRQWIFIVLGLVMLLYLPWTLFIKSRSQILSNPSFQEPLKYILDEEGLTVSQGEAWEKMAWEDMHKAVSTGRSIILYTSRVNATLFPKRLLGDKKAAVIEIISTHMPPAKVKIRS
ncbi:MAG: YcxB family protein [Lachnospiraceae bacterium]|nr:YcxB family protein [Lachnospiraceae bacterium]